MEQNKVRTYILYAIGEIFLVVVGILIALQVNNWNEERKERRQEGVLLSQIKNDLNTNLRDLETLTGRLIISRNSADSLLKSFRSDIKVEGFVFHASLIHRRFFFSPTTTAYAQLRTSASNVVQNEKLRNRVISIYESEFSEISKRQELLSEHMNSILFPLSMNRFNLDKQITFTMKDFDQNSMDFYDPVDFDQLSKDREFINAIVVLKRLYTIQLNQLERTAEAIQSTLSFVEQELNTNH